MNALEEYRKWCVNHVRESVGFNLADVAIAELEGENERLRRVIGAAVEDSANLEAERDRAHDDAGNLEGEVNSLKASRWQPREGGEAV